ncbi:hypothetical protein Droror1_Dr00009004 [Drosera rotundifolia]
MAVGSSIPLKLIAMMVAYMVVSAPYVAGISCGDAEKELIPCLPYLTAIAKEPTGGCCKGVKTVNEDAKTTDSRRVVCSCLKSLLEKYPAVKEKNAGDLSGKCGVPLPYTVSKSTDCSKIH